MQTIELEAQAERETKFPVKPIEVAGFQAIGKYDDTFPQGTFSTHEGLTAYKKPGSETIYVTEGSREAAKQLEDEGLLDAGGNYGVPYTGALGSERSGQDFDRIDAGMSYNRASREAGLKELNYDALTDDQKAELQKIGLIDTSANSPSLLSSAPGNAFEASSGSNLTVEEREERLKSVGSYAELVVPFNNGNEAPLIAFTDHRGNQVVAPASDTLKALIDSLGYRRVDQPTFNPLPDAQDGSNSLVAARNKKQFDDVLIRATLPVRR